MKSKLFVFVLMFSLVAFAQSDLQKKYPFLKLEQNQVTYPGDSLPFFKFYEKLDQLFFEGQGQVNIVHMGGSHVQAGMLSNRMRENMLEYSPGIKNERGFFFPYRLAHTNNPSNYFVKSNGTWEGYRCSVNSYVAKWGASGVNATTLDSNIYISIYAFDGQEMYGFKKVRIYYLFEKDSYVPQFDASYNLLSVTYDSIAHYAEFNFAEMYDTLRFNIVKTDSNQNRFTIQGVQYITEGASLNYNSIGVNGASTKSYLRCVDFGNQIQGLKADLVIFGIGINDAYKPESYFSEVDFENNYEAIMAMFKKVNPDVAFLFLSNNDSYYKRRYANPNALKVSKVMVKLCKKHGAAYWDLFEIMGGFNSIKTWENYKLAKSDKIHFTRAGYTLQADLLSEALMMAYGRYLKSKSK